MVSFKKIFCKKFYLQVFLVIKNPPASAGDTGEASSIPGVGRSPGEGNGNPLQCSCLENPMDRGAWWATVHGVTKNWTRLSYQHTFKAPKWKSVLSCIVSWFLLFCVFKEFRKPLTLLFVFLFLVPWWCNSPLLLFPSREREVCPDCLQGAPG